MGVIVGNGLSDIEIKTTGGCLTEVKVNGENVRCSAFTLEQCVGEIPVIELEIIQPVINVGLKGRAEIANKKEIAKLMSDVEFNEFCKIWLEVHGYKEGDVVK